ncbi:MAG: alkaline phosphatase family protein [Acidobacteriaceae bacterium]
MATALVLTGCSNTTPVAPTIIGPTVLTPVTSSQVIKHVVVIFGENISFDHYFGTYPNAANLSSDAVKFTAATGTPTNISNYVTSPDLLTANPNLNISNGAGATNPFRLDAAQAATEDQDHNYNPEQLAFDDGKMDLFPMSVGSPDSAETTTLATSTGAPAIANTTGLTMGYFDGNTVTALWNYAQHYALNDHSFGTTFGPSTTGAINLISGQTNGAVNTIGASSAVVADGNGGLTDIGDADPTGDICSSTSKSITMANGGKNIGDLLNAAGVTWGWFEGGFNLSITNPNGTTGCARTTTSAVTGVTENDYIQHHEPFQYYASTQNLMHNRPTSVATIGTTDAANHQYDTTDFTAALAAGNLPAVSFLKAPGYQDAHAGYSDPIDEQAFVVSMVNAIEQSADWSSTAIIIDYDDSDGWYDNLTDIVNGSTSASDAAICNAVGGGASLPGPDSGTTPVLGRCGHGPRLPLLVISPWANKNYVDNTPTDQSSIIRFVEDTFLSSKRIGTGSFDASAGTLNNMFNFTNNVAPNPNVVLLNPTTGVVTSGN